MSNPHLDLVVDLRAVIGKREILAFAAGPSGEAMVLTADPEDAASAVKHFNKSFIRMSRLGVEIAKAVRVPLLSP